VSTIAKVFVVVVFALSVAFAVSSALLMTQQENWHDKYAKLDRDSQQKSADQEAKLAARDHDLQETKSALSKTTGDLQRITEEKAEADKAKAQLQTDFTAKEKEVSDLRTSFTMIRDGVGQWSARNEKLQKDLTDAQAKLKENEEALRQSKADSEKAKIEKDEMVKKLADMEARRKDLEDRLARATEALDNLAKSGVINMEEVVSGAQKPIDGRVLEVDPGNKVVIINVGKEQGVGLGYAFTVYRDGEYVGEIRVDQLKDDLAGGSPVLGKMKSEIRKGDNVTTRIR
jgi:predicted nuclease with TOPRIM domain